MREAVFRVSGGNPFYLSQLARLAANQPVARRRASQDVDTLTLGVPQSVMSMLAEEVRSLPPGSRRVLEAAAVAGEPFEPDVAAEIGEVTEAEVGGALDDLLARDLVRATDVPRQFRFRHPLVRRAVYAHAGGGWRLAAHGRAAAALASRGASAAAQAHHVEHSARRGDETAIALLSRAAARRGAARARDGGALAAGGGAARSRGGVAAGRRAARGAAAASWPTPSAASGRLDACRKTLLQALELVGEDAAARVRLVTACAAVEHWLGPPPEASARLDAALAELGDERSAGAVALRIERAVEHLHALDFGAALAVAEQALDVAGELGDPRALGAAGAMLTLTAVAAGDVKRARETVGDAAAQLDGLRDDELADDLAALWYLGWARAAAGALRTRARAPAARRRDLARDRPRRPDRADAARGGRAGCWRSATRPRRPRPPRRRSSSRAARATRSTSSAALWQQGRVQLVAGDHNAAQILAEEALDAGARAEPAAARAAPSRR